MGLIGTFALRTTPRTSIMVDVDPTPDGTGGGDIGMAVGVMAL